MNSLKEAQFLPAAISPPAARLRSMAGIHPKQHLAQDLGSRGAFKTSLCAHISPGCEHCFRNVLLKQSSRGIGAMCLYHIREDCLTLRFQDKTFCRLLFCWKRNPFQHFVFYFFFLNTLRCFESQLKRNTIYFNSFHTSGIIHEFSEQIKPTGSLLV